jgi:short-subunit dehydrogenase
LNGKRVFVVGGTSGIGLSTAKAFVDESANVIIASRSASKLSEAKRSLGDNVEAYELDFLTTEKQQTFSTRLENLITW